MLEQMQTKDNKPIGKMRHKGSLLVEYAIVLGLAAIFLVFNGLFDPIGDKAEKNAKAVNKDAYVYGGVPKGSVTQAPDGTTAPTHSSGGQIIAGSSDKPGDDIKTDINFSYDRKDKNGDVWSTDVKDGIIKETIHDGNTKYFSIASKLSFGLLDVNSTYKIYFTKDINSKTTKFENKDMFRQLEIQIIKYSYNNNGDLVSKVLAPNGSDGNDYYPIQDIVLHITEPCYIALNFRGTQKEFNAINPNTKEEFILNYIHYTVSKNN